MDAYRIVERRRAIEKALNYIYELACDEERFKEWGHDMLCCFHGIAATSSDSRLKKMARQMGRERAARWRLDNSEVPEDADAGTIINLVFGCLSADRLGVRDKGIKTEIKAAAGRLSAEDYYWFDPSKEPPPADVPEDCECGAANSRGATACGECRASLVMKSPYLVWTDALIMTYMGERYGARLGASYSQAIKWLPHMKPFPVRNRGANPDFSHAVYAVTHVVYTLNDYSKYRLSPSIFCDEFEFLKSNLEEVVALEDPEMMGEFLDAVRAFGLSDFDPLVRAGMDFLLSRQNTNGSWGEKTEEVYRQYHPTWTAIDGLREYCWKGEGLSFPKLKHMFERSRSRVLKQTPAVL